MDSLRPKKSPKKHRPGVATGDKRCQDARRASSAHKGQGRITHAMEDYKARAAQLRVDVDKAVAVAQQLRDSNASAEAVEMASAASQAAAAKLREAEEALAAIEAAEASAAVPPPPPPPPPPQAPDAVATVAFSVTAGATRCFLCGWLTVSASKLLGAHAQPGTGLLAARPAMFGAALAGCCALWHGAFLGARRLLRKVDEAAVAGLAGTVTGMTLVRWAPELASAQTELHSSTVLRALRTFVGRDSIAMPPSSATASSKTGEGGVLAAARSAVAPTVLACVASWRLLSAPAHTLPTNSARWLSTLALPPLSASATNSAAIAASSVANASGLVATRPLVGAARHGLARGVRSYATGAGPASLLLNAADVWRAPLRALRQCAFEAAAAGALHAIGCALLRGGGDARARLGWAAGLSVLLLPSRERRVDVALRLGAQAALSALCGAGALALPRGGHFARGATGGAVEVVVLGAAAGRLLHQYARAMAGSPSALDAQTARTVHFLLGFNEHIPDPGATGAGGATGGVPLPSLPEGGDGEEAD